jgi:chemotaxis protein histidine kinase CheA
MLAALGWDVTNLEHVARDWPLEDGASISYALRLRDGSALFVETAPVNASVDEQTLVDEVLAHVSTADTRWCLLTNGLRYRLFKADDAVAKDNRLMFDVELAEVASDPASEAANDLALLTRDSLMDGVLEARGEEFYIDPRIQQALLELCRAPSSSFINAMNEAVGDPPVPVRRLRASLGRAVDDGRRSAARRTPPAEVPTLGRPRTSRAPAHAAAADEGEASSEPHPAATASLPTAPATIGPATIDEESATLATVDSPSIESSDEIAAAPELADENAPAVDAESALADDAEVVNPTAPELTPEQAAEQELLEQNKLLEDAELAEEQGAEQAAETEQAEERELPEEAAEIAAAPTVHDADAVSAEMVEPALADEALVATLAATQRVEQPEQLEEEPEREWKVAPPGRFGRQPEYPLVDHFAGKPDELVELFDGLDRFAHGLGDDTARRVRRQNIEYYRGGQVWFAITFLGDAVRITLTVESSEFDAWREADPARALIASSPVDILGEIEITLQDASRLTDGCELIRMAYASTT